MMSTTSDAGEHGWPAQYAFTPGKRASVIVVEAVSAAANATVEQLPILYDVIDPDALDALFESATGDGDGFDGELSFNYGGFRVTVSSRAVTVRPATQ